MNVTGFIKTYFTDYMWMHKGYNLVNTVTYALIAICALYLIYRLFKRTHVVVDKVFVLNVIPFILLGSTVRVVTDSIDTGVMQQYSSNPVYSFILNSHVYDYGYFTVTPGIYIVTTVLMLVSLYIFKLFKRENMFGIPALILWTIHFFILLPMAKNWVYAVLIIILTLSVYIAAKLVRKKYNLSEWTDYMVIAQGLDGAATFVSIDIYNRFSEACTMFSRCYREQHVLSSYLGQHTFFVFFVVKVTLALLAGFYLTYVYRHKEINEQVLAYLALIVITIGLAPGIRDTLRLWVGA